MTTKLYSLMCQAAHPHNLTECFDEVDITNQGKWCTYHSSEIWKMSTSHTRGAVCQANYYGPQDNNCDVRRAVILTFGPSFS